MKFKDLDDFAGKYPHLDELVRKGKSKFLVDIRERITARKGLNKRMLAALEKLKEEEDEREELAVVCPRVGELVKDMEITVTRVYTDRGEGVLVFEFDSEAGWSGRVKDVTRKSLFEEAKAKGWELGAAKDKAKGSPFKLVIVSGRPVWKDPASPYVVFGNARTRTRRRSRGFGGVGAPDIRLPSEVGIAVPVPAPYEEKPAPKAKPTFSDPTLKPSPASLVIEGNGKGTDRHEWMRDHALGLYVCVCCGKQITDIDILDFDLEILKTEKCPHKVHTGTAGPKPEVLPESSNPDGERAGLLPDFTDWRSKMGF